MLTSSWLKFKCLNKWHYTSLHNPTKEGLLQHIVESAHLSTLVALYNCHFSMYNIGKKYGTQLILNVVWKFVY
jgi:hypothetical protein